MDPTPKEREDKKQLSSNRDSEENESHASGPYPITLKPTLSPKLTKKISSAKGRLSAIRSSLRKDVEGIKSSIRKSPKLTKSKSHESIKAEEMPPKKNKSKKSKAASLVRRLSIGKQKTQIQATEIPQQDDKSESSTSSITPSAMQQPQHSVSESSLLKIEDTVKPQVSDVSVRNSDVSDIIVSREPSLENTDVLEDYLNNLGEGQSPTTIQILPPLPPDSPTLSFKSDQEREHEKTESCDEENEFTEDNLSEPTMSSMIESNPERREHLYKILVIGELGTGKTSIIKRYVHQFFSQHYRATIGVDFALKLINWDANTVIRLQLWDIAGQERFGNMTRVYYKEAVGAFIVFDVTRVATFDAVVKWKMDLDAKVQLSDGSPIPCILLANKCDQQKEGLVNTPAKMDEYCKERGFAGWFETSAKENINIEEAGRALVNKILLNDKIINGNDPNKENETIALDGKAAKKNGSDNPTSNKFCSC